MGITKGQQFKIVVRQITSSGRKGASGQRYVYGAFQVSIPVSTKAQMLVPEERSVSHEMDPADNSHHQSLVLCLSALYRAALGPGYCARRQWGNWCLNANGNLAWVGRGHGHKQA